MNFPERDFFDQFISSSFQDVAEVYLNTGSLLYFLNGRGQVVLGIPTSSLDSQATLIRIDSSSYSEFAVTSSFALNFNPNATASYALSASNATNAITSTSSSWASSSLSASYLSAPHNTLNGLQGGSSPNDYYHLTGAEYTGSGGTGSFLRETGSFFFGTSSWSQNSFFAVSSSYSATSSITLITQSMTAISASWASRSFASESSSFASSSISSSFAQTASYLIYPSSLVSVPSASTKALILQTSSINNSVFINYTLNDGGNFRAGNVVVIYNTSSVNLAETTTTDIGDSGGLTISANVSNTFITVSAVNNTSNNFTIKYHYDIL